MRYLGIKVDDALEISEQTEICSTGIVGRPIPEASLGNRAAQPSLQLHRVGLGDDVPERLGLPTPPRRAASWLDFLLTLSATCGCSRLTDSEAP